MTSALEGRPLDDPEIQTPAVLVDLDRLECNVGRMADRARRAGVILRPHTKTHKSVWIAELQLARGARGVTVATVGEAEVMVAAGIRDVLIAYPVVGAAKLRRLEVLADQADVSVALDDVLVAEGIAGVGRDIGRPISVYVEVDSGLGRCGKAPGVAAAEVVRAVARMNGVVVVGLLTHAGHAYRVSDASELRHVAVQEAKALVDTAEVLRKAGLQVPVLSVGSTPTAPFIEEVVRDYPVTEIRPGTYVFNDANQVALGSATQADCALSVLTTVVSRPERDRVVIDAGSKTLGADVGVASGYGRVKGQFGIQIAFLNEAHGVMQVPSSCDWQVGSRVEIIPNHACIPPSLADEMLAVRRGIVESVIRVDARGRNR